MPETLPILHNLSDAQLTRWTRELRRGHWRQTRNTLRHAETGAMCVLGLFCHLTYGGDAWTELPDPSAADLINTLFHPAALFLEDPEDGGYTSSMLPPSLARQLNVTREVHLFAHTDRFHLLPREIRKLLTWRDEPIQGTTLVALNDSHALTFRQLADLIDYSFRPNPVVEIVTNDHTIPSEVSATEGGDAA